MGVPDPLRTVLSTYCNVEACDVSKLCAYLSRSPEIRAQALSQLQQAIDTNALSPASYTQLTGEDFDTQEELNAWLRTLHGRISAA